MRPIKIEFQAFGPYVGHEVVDFEAISEKGLFLICGKTGMGKTTILDAMTFALYGKSSGHGRDDFEAMRCTNAAFDKTTFVKFEFENNGNFYLFERRLERKRKNLSPAYNLMKKDEEGVWKTLLENAKEKALNDKAIEIIGLEYEQFRQVIVLPQGQFEKLLTSNSDEKEKILTSIFGEEKWQEIAEKLYQEVDERKENLKEIKNRILNSLKEEQCESMGQLRLLIDHKKAELTSLDEESKEADYDNKIKALQDEQVLAKRFNDLHNAEKQLEVLKATEHETKQWEQKVKDSERAEKVRAFIDASDSALEQLDARKEFEKNTRKEAEKAKITAEASALKLEEHLKRENEVEENKALKIQYEGKRDDYEALDKTSEELKAKENEEKQALKIEEAAKKIYDAFAPKIVNLNEEYSKLNEEHSSLLNSYLIGITGELAEQLKDGMPCPVCGSLTHPNKAIKGDNSITRDIVDAKKDEVDQKYDELQRTIEKQSTAKTDLDNKHLIVENKHAEVVSKNAEFNKIKNNLVEGLNSLVELNNKIDELDKSINEFANKKSKLEEKEKKDNISFREAQAKIEPAENETRNAELLYKESLESVEAALKEHGFDSKEEAKELLLDEAAVNELNQKVKEYDTNVKAAKTNFKNLSVELEGKTEPDIESCKSKLEEITNAKDLYIEKRGVINSEIARLTNKKNMLEADDEGIDEKIREAEEDFAFAKRLRGDSGTGLQRYVLGIMFSSVVTAANQMLEMVHGGRYRLYRSDEKAQGSNKRGLELKVFDKNSEDHEGRSVRTLSGGEKFLTSLALSIGMSTIAQKSGIKIEALFIDEGFGSLDEDSIGDAMNVLNSIQEANGIVGIISHVQLLQDRIPTKLRVEEIEKGSHIVQTIG
ncbi:AAA family ATPase [Pseudobutyrivibrio xylanivorans]|uniref:Nuclease SbcCD subunit C n=1 Tax=Pseudobutyrivibrio xylanivorans TaxID=185007 RepID=A0A1G5S4N7_PSEXY|nr:SMC family ATPase [Pseudobutyrivibrio xylanivorans]SCZ81334.1 DNA sulfur modification protein DndD [Pseudobutyrivibrio xylanivorans]